MDNPKSFKSLVRNLKKPGKQILDEMTPSKADAIHMAGGICSEAGELFDAIKSWVVYGQELDGENVIEELGDLEFFLEGLRQILGISRTATVEKCEIKLRKRYPEMSYTDEHAKERLDKSETLDK